MKRRLVTALALMATAVVAMITFASPAQAGGFPGYVLYKTFNWPDACSSAGYYWQQQGLFHYYYCDAVQAANPASGPGIYNLWVAY